MGLLDTIEKIQKRPINERKKIMAVSMTVSMMIVIAIWLISLQHSINSGLAQQNDSVPSPFSILLSGTKNTWQNITNEAAMQFNKIKDTVNKNN